MKLVGIGLAILVVTSIGSGVAFVVSTRLGDDEQVSLPQWTTPERIYFKRGTDLWSITPDGAETDLVASGLRQGYCGTIGQGNTAPLPSPRGDLVAFISFDGSVRIADATGGNAWTVSDNPRPDDDIYYGTQNSISGWSPDGSRLIYHVSMTYDPHQKKEPFGIGFYLVDVINRDRKPLRTLPNFVAWSADPNQVIFQQQSTDYEAPCAPTPCPEIDWYSLDLTSGAATRMTKEPFPCTSMQPAKYAANNRLSYGCANTSTQESTIVVARGDNTERIVLARGGYAEFQSPAPAPSGEQFMYRHQSEPYISGSVNVELRLFDLASDVEHVLLTGCPIDESWLSATVLLVAEQPACGTTLNLYRLNIETGIKTILADNITLQ